ncbi:hypothetical protein [Dysgonomonas macrotermitis]|nr:hypothetical protein [Dysgonomonas macrotermitis]
MKKKMLLLMGIISFGISYAQVGINTQTPHASAALEVVSPGNNKGVLISRMNTNQKQAITSPAEGLIVYDTDKKCLSQNVGTELSPIWICLTQNQTRFFYMPAVAIDASTIVTGRTLDLYTEYKTQFGSPDAKSTSAPGGIPYFPSANDLYYYITYYDPSVIKINTVDDDGKVSYDILKEADYQSFMNVVFVVK